MFNVFLSYIHRSKKNMLLFWATSFILCFLNSAQNSKILYSNGQPYTVDNYFFSNLSNVLLVGIVFVILTLSVEYSEGTIRNKIITGNNRFSIYSSSLLFSIFSTIFIATSFILALMPFLVTKGPLSTPYNIIVLNVIALVFVIIYISAISNVISLTVRNQALAIICGIVMFIGTFILSDVIISELLRPQFINDVLNPLYLSGVKRKLYETVLMLLPSGQVLAIMNFSIKNILYIALYDAFAISMISVVGYKIFKRTDIK